MRLKAQINSLIRQAFEAVAGDPPATHAALHENGGTDEISVTGLSGLLADAQTPLTHTHTQGDVTGLSTALSNKLDSSSYTAADVLTKIKTVDGAGSGLDADLLDGSSSAAFAAASHSHAQSDVTSLTSDLASKLNSSSYTAADVLSKLLTVDGAGSGLDADLLDGSSSAAFAAASHNHAASEISSGTIATARLGSGTADSTTFLRGDQTWQTPSGGSDPWTYVVLSSDFTTTSASNTNVTGLAFTPSANKNYEMQGCYIVRTATATVGTRPGLSWPTGLNEGVAQTTVPNSTTASALMNHSSVTGTANAASTGLPVAARSYLAYMWGVVVTGGSPSGNVQVTVASETAGTTVTVRAGSFIKYREYS